MAFAPPNEKKRAYDEALAKAANAENERLEELRKHNEPDDETLHDDVRMCYQQYLPAQLAKAGQMIEYGRKSDEREARVRVAQASGEVCWERLGGNRGPSKRNCYRLLVM